MHTTLQLLPFDLKFLILRASPDIAALTNLTSASNEYKMVFERYKSIITTSVLSRDFYTVAIFNTEHQLHDYKGREHNGVFFSSRLYALNEASDFIARLVDGDVGEIDDLATESGTKGFIRYVKENMKSIEYWTNLFAKYTCPNDTEQISPSEQNRIQETIQKLILLLILRRKCGKSPADIYTYVYADNDIREPQLTRHLQNLLYKITNNDIWQYKALIIFYKFLLESLDLVGQAAWGYYSVLYYTGQMYNIYDKDEEDAWRRRFLDRFIVDLSFTAVTDIHKEISDSCYSPPLEKYLSDIIKPSAQMKFYEPLLKTNYPMTLQTPKIRGLTQPPGISSFCGSLWINGDIVRRDAYIWDDNRLQRWGCYYPTDGMIYALNQAGEETRRMRERESNNLLKRRNGEMEGELEGLKRKLLVLRGQGGYNVVNILVGKVNWKFHDD